MSVCVRVYVCGWVGGWRREAVVRDLNVFDLLEVTQNDAKFQPYLIFEINFLKVKGGYFRSPIPEQPLKHPS